MGSEKRKSDLLGGERHRLNASPCLAEVMLTSGSEIVVLSKKRVSQRVRVLDGDR
jgi:hypothetical protein